MKTNKTTILIAAVTLVIGLLAGGLLFRNSGSEAEPVHEHVEEAGGETTWTCSMHPQIRQPEPGDCPICGMDLIPLEDESQEGADPTAISMSPTAMQLANIRTTVVGKSEPVKTVRLNGKVLPDERRVVSQTSHIPGRIENLAVNFTGEYVKQGQTIASIYSPQLVTAQEELFEAARIRESQPQLFRAAREKLKNWKLSDQQIDQILESDAPAETFDIVADASGYVTGKMVNQGDYVQRGQAIYEIADLSRVWVLFDVYEQDLQWINRGNRIQFSVQSLPGETFEGTISWISPVINPRTRVAQARLELSNSGLRLRPEMFATGIVESKLNTAAGSLTIPKSAVMWTGKRSLVYVKNSSEQAIQFNMREVTLGPSLGDNFVVQGGLDEGEEIAVSGTFSIDAAAQLSGKPSMMMRPESKTMDVPQQFRQQITRVAQTYFDLKNALVNDDAETASKTAAEVTAALNNTDMALLDGGAHDHWMMLLKPMQDAAKAIGGTADIEEQRKDFNTLSNHLIEMTESFGLEIDRAYKQFCPMAFDDEGAYWLSESDEVLNPYFGDMMLRCGEVQETYRKGQNVFRKNEGNSSPATAGHNH